MIKRILTVSALALGLGIAGGAQDAQAWWGWGPWGGGPWNGTGASDVGMSFQGSGHHRHHYWHNPGGYAPWGYGPYSGSRWGSHPWGWGGHPGIPHAYGAPYGYVPPQPQGGIAQPGERGDLPGGNARKD